MESVLEFAETDMSIPEHNQLFDFSCSTGWSLKTNSNSGTQPCANDGQMSLVCFLRRRFFKFSALAEFVMGLY